MSEEFETGRVVTGDVFDVIPEWPTECVHAVVTDPPYGLAFMGRDWDDFEPKEYQEWCENWARECKRVLKPGGHLLAFSGNRTHHRLFTGVEDAGFEIRDTLTWHYGSGFPKAADVGKTIDKRADAEREVIGTRRQRANSDKSNISLNHYGGDVEHITAPATDEAKKWDGWKTGLKPATEYVVMARKPFDGATVDCVQEHGTGALNIDGCRVGTDERTNPPTSHNDNCYADAGNRAEETVEGRYPSNVVFDETAAHELDEKVGELAAGARTPRSDERNVYSNGDAPSSPNERVETDSGGPSRYFYTSKASKSERSENGQIDNAHPTVKPTDLMEWLVKLVTREGQIVMDPFAGSGTTCKAAKALGREFVGIERQAKWADVARARIGLEPHDPSHVQFDDDQTAIMEYFE